MSDVREILVGVDFSKGSRAALELAAVLAEKARANLHVLHVWPPTDFVSPGDRRAASIGESFGKLIEIQAKAELGRFVSEAKERGISIGHAFIESGVPSQTIVALAKRQGYDLIVLGTQGQSGLARVLLGSVAERVVRLAPCPVVTVPEGFVRVSPIERLLVAVDYSEGSRVALERAAGIAAVLGAEIDIMHVWDRPSYVPEQLTVQEASGARRPLGELIRENVEQQMQDFLATCPAVGKAGPLAKPSYRLRSGNPVAVLCEELGRGRHGLVVLGTHGRSGLRRMLLGSVAEKLIRLSPVPVITVPPLVSTAA